MASAADSFEVSFVKEGSFGMTLDEHSFLVKKILPSGCVAKFNQAQPESAIREGDVIKSINGEAASMAALKAVVEGQEVKFTIGRGRPQQQVMGAGQVAAAPPPGVPEGSKFTHENFVGGKTNMFALGGCLCCGPLACLICLCPVDERDVYVAPDGRKFTTAGALIE